MRPTCPRSSLAARGDRRRDGPRLQRPALLRRHGQPVLPLGTFDDAAQAAAALRISELDVLLIYEPHLHAGCLASIEAAAPTFAGVPKAVLYGFAADPVCDALATAGTALPCEPQPDAVVAQWLHSLSMAAKRPLPPADQVARDRAYTAGTMRPWPTSRAGRRRWPASARATWPSCWCSRRTSRPTAPSAGTAVQPTPSCTPICGKSRPLRALVSRPRSGMWPCTRASSCLRLFLHRRD